MAGTNGGKQLRGLVPGTLYYRGSPERGVDPEPTDEYSSRMQNEIIAIWTKEWPKSFGCDLLIAWHRNLLSGIVGVEEVVGRLRAIGMTSVFEVWEDTPTGPHGCRRQGMGVEHDGEVEAAVRSACDAFLTAAAVAAPDVATAVRPISRFYIELLRIRPFALANDHVAHLALHATYRMRLLEPPGPGMAPRAYSPEGVKFNRAIAAGLQLRSPSIEPLVQFLTANSKLMR
jgi:hypothetical protein